MAVASSFPGLLLPDLVLLARPVQSKKQPPRLELTRLLPAQLVRLFVHSEAGWRLKLRLASGRSFYLRLVAEPAEGCLLFNRWRFLIYLMQGPIPAWARSPDEQAAQDESAPMSAAEAPPKRKEVAFPPQYPVPRTKGSPGWTWDKALHYPGPLSQLMDQQSAQDLPEVMSRAEAAPMSFRSQQKLPVRREEKQKRSTPGSLVEVEGQPSVTIRTLFSTISGSHLSKAAAPAETSSSGPSRPPSQEHPKEPGTANKLPLPQEQPQPQELPQEQPQPQELPQEQPQPQELPQDQLQGTSRPKERDSSGEPRTVALYILKKLRPGMPGGSGGSAASLRKPPGSPQSSPRTTRGTVRSPPRPHSPAPVSRLCGKPSRSHRAGSPEHGNRAKRWSAPVPGAPANPLPRPPNCIRFFFYFFKIYFI
uniref:Protein FAM71E2-like n=1 Tax=Monodelphis domestica TaxID=13616 RepID=A0A5F8GA71_MONDO